MIERREVGVYIDVDNYVIPFDEIPFDARRDQVRKGINFVLETSEGKGEIAEVRAYANYAKQPFWLHQLFCAYGIGMIFTPSLNGSGKNVDDEEMAKDITLAAYTRPEIGAIVVVSADGHFVPAISSARRRGCKVIVICTGEPNTVLREAADEVILINCHEQIAENPKADTMANEPSHLLADIELLVRERGEAFDRQSLIEALAQKKSKPSDREQIEAIVNGLIHRNVITFSMSNGGAERCPKLHIDRSAMA